MTSSLLSMLAAMALAAGAARPSTPAAAGANAGTAELRLSATPPPPSERFTAFGMELSAGTGGLKVDHVLAGSQAAELGLMPGDILLDLCGSGSSDAASLAQALVDFKPETRRWAVVRRGGGVVTLESELPRVRLASGRSPQDLSPLEQELVRKHLEEAKGREAEVLKNLATPRLDIGVGQRTWIQLPTGLLPDAKKGDVVAGIVATGLAADAALDYLAIPPRSEVWAEILSTSSKDEVRTVRLHVFKLKLLGGHSYPVSARVTDVAGDGQLTQASPGGTIVTADPAGLGPGTRLQIEFASAFSLYEAPAYYRAGVGLWLKQRVVAADRALEVSHVIAGRSADRAGIQVGDLLNSVGGSAAAKLDFIDALDRLYGAPGSKIALRVQRGDKAVEGAMELTRGVRYDTSTGLEVDWTAKGPGLLVSSVAPDSPAAKAGVHPGERLVRFGSLAVEDMPPAKVKELLQRDLTDENSVTITGQAGAERSLAIKRSWTQAAVPPPYK